MTSLDGKPLLTAAEMRAAEDAAIAGGATVQSLMDRAGREVAEMVRRLGSGNEVLILCGPGNNGGDGYVAATALHAAGVSVRVAMSAEPRTEAAKYARARWSGEVEELGRVAPAPILVDALFGTGLSRALDDSIASDLTRLRDRARLAIAVDLPSGVTTGDGAVLNRIPTFDLTLALGAAKPSHLLYPAAGHCGTVRVLDIGVPVSSNATVLGEPHLPAPGPDSHKYTRGMVAIVGGEMRGAAELAALAAMRAGVGYVLLLADGSAGEPHAIVRRPFAVEALNDTRIGAVVIGAGLGRGAIAGTRLDLTLASFRPLVIDGDALHLLDENRLARLRTHAAPVVLTPHAGEFEALFGKDDGSKIDRARAAAAKAGATIVFKGADTVIAAPDGQVRVAQGASRWLSTAGTGDVLAGAIGAMLAARPGSAIDAAAAGVWLHSAAAARLTGVFIADDLAEALSTAWAAR
jgi:hydroxyethylthiazole kinase-like uncharacterized protein yjeF